jgi:hypothetical protein
MCEQHALGYYSAKTEWPPEMETIKLISALRYGAIGLGCILAVLSYILLRKEQDRDAHRPQTVTAIYIYMLFSFLLAAAGFAAEYLKNEQEAVREASQLKRQLQEAKDQIAAKDELLKSVAVATIVEQPSGPAGSQPVAGEWEFSISSSAGVNSDGLKREMTDEITIRLALQQSGRTITGKYLWATGRACARANVTGAVVGSAVELIVHYSGNCCGGARMRITGRLLSATQMDLAVQPVGIPPRPDCDVWWATGLGTKMS